MGNRFLVPSVVPGGMTLISTTTLSGASVVLSSIPQTFVNLQLQIESYRPANDQANLLMRLNADTGTSYKNVTTNSLDSADTFMGMDASSIKITGQQDNTVARGNSIIDILNYTIGTIYKLCNVKSLNTDSGNTDGIRLQHSIGIHNQFTNAVTSITLLPSSGNFTSGTVKLYGVK